MDGIVEVCRVTISRYLNAPVRVGSSYRVEYYFIYFLVAGTNTGKRVAQACGILEVDGRVEVCRVTISRYLISNAPVRVGSGYHHFEVPISNAPVRVGSGYRLEYYFIYFPVVVQTQGSVLSSKWTVVWKSAGSPFPGTYKQCASKSRLSL